MLPSRSIHKIFAEPGAGSERKFQRFDWTATLVKGIHQDVNIERLNLKA